MIRTDNPAPLPRGSALEEDRQPPDEEARDAVRRPAPVARGGGLLWTDDEILRVAGISMDKPHPVDLRNFAREIIERRAENASLRLEVQRLTEQLDQTWSRVKSAEAARPPSDAEHRLRLILDFVELVGKR